MTLGSFNSKSPKFLDRKPWHFSVDGEVIEWRPSAPYLFARSEQGMRVIVSMKKLFDSLRVDSEGNVEVAPPGGTIIHDLSNPHMVAYLASYLWGNDESEEFDEDTQEWVQVATRQLKFSRNAPKLIAIFGPTHTKDGHMIIY